MKTLEFVKKEINSSKLGVFETIKVENGCPLRLKIHYNRMLNSLKILGIGTLPDFETFEKELTKINLANKNFLKLIATKKGISIETGNRNIPSSPVNIVIIKHISANSQNPLLLHKTINRHILKKITEFAEKYGCYDGIILNEKGNITQTSKCNIYFETREGEIITPPLNEGVLPGTIRSILIKRKLVKERTINKKEIEQFKKCFISNALIGVIEANILV